MRHGVLQRAALRFVHGDKRVEDDDTPDSVRVPQQAGHVCTEDERCPPHSVCSPMQLGLEDGDQVDAMIQQTGGSLCALVGF